SVCRSRSAAMSCSCMPAMSRLSMSSFCFAASICSEIFRLRSSALSAMARPPSALSFQAGRPPRGLYSGTLPIGRLRSSPKLVLTSGQALSRSAGRGLRRVWPVPQIFERREQPVDVVLEGDLALDVAAGENATRLGDPHDLEVGFVHVPFSPARL